MEEAGRPAADKALHAGATESGVALLDTPSGDTHEEDDSLPRRRSSRWRQSTGGSLTSANASGSGSMKSKLI